MALDRWRRIGLAAALALNAAPIVAQETRPSGEALYQSAADAFSAGRWLEAGRAASKLAPFDHPDGPHARFILGRVHAQFGEWPEAAEQFKLVAGEFEKQKKSAADKLREPQKLTPEAKAALEKIANAPPPQWLGESLFRLAEALEYQAKTGEAAAQYDQFLQKWPKHALAAEARLRRGTCLVEVRSFIDAIRTLDAIKNDPVYADRALLQMARAQAGLADPANPQQFKQHVTMAAETLKNAAAAAAQATDAGAKQRRCAALAELGDAQQLIAQHAEAAKSYRTALDEKIDAERAEEVTARLATALTAASDFAASDQVVAHFARAWPTSPHMGEVLLRAAQNAAGVAKNPRAWAAAATKFEAAVTKHPESPTVNAARLGWARALIELKEHAKAADALAGVPEGDRGGDLAIASYLQADCLLRTLPASTDDALSAGRLLDQAERAVRLLEQFVGSGVKGPALGDALLKLAQSYGRMGAMLVEPAERKAVLDRAREAYDKASREVKAPDAVAAVALGRAQCLAMLGDPNAAVNELRRFASDPLKNTPDALAALVHWSQLLRAQNKPAEAAKVMEEAAKRPDATDVIRHEHAIALIESGKHAEARSLLAANKGPQANWLAARGVRMETAALLDAARKARPDEREAKLAEAVTKAAALQSLVKSEGPVDPRILLEQAAAARLIGDAENEARLLQLRRESLAAIKKGERAPAEAAPTSERSAQVTALLEQFLKLDPAGDDAVRARVELAEFAAAAGQHDKAIDLLNDALEQDPRGDLADLVKARLAAAHLAKGAPDVAVSILAPVLKKNPLAPEPRRVLGEAHLAKKEPQKAVETLVPFRDNEKLRNVPGVTERALLKLGQAYLALNQLDPARQAYESALSRLGNSILSDEARFDLAAAFQKHRRFDDAANHYSQITQRSASEWAARAQLQIGLCRLEQKRHADAVAALLAVAKHYDYREWSAQARFEAARAHVEAKQPTEATKLLERVIEDHPGGKWSALAQERLLQLQQQLK